MNTVFFSNHGELDARLITIMGTNVKTSEGAIGTFGTGLKYAIAVTLRLGGQIAIQSGTRTMIFRTEPEEIRGKTFGLIYMDTADANAAADAAPATQQLGFTTELGKNWEAWMAFRELYCNALDEPGANVGIMGDHQPRLTAAGRTNIYVVCDAIADAYRNRSKWFLFGGIKAPLKALDASTKVELYPYRGDNAYFYRGIKVGDFTNRPRFTYNFLDGITLTEDRTAHEYYTYYILAREAYSNLKSLNVLADIVIPRDEEPCMELGLPWSDCYAQPSEAMLSLVREKRQTARALIPRSLMTKISPHLPQEAPKGIYLTDIQTEVLQRAVAFLSRMGVEINRKIVVLETLGGQYTGLASHDTIFIAQAVLDAGPKSIAANLLIEWLSTEKDMAFHGEDMTSWLVTKVLSQAEEIFNTTI